MIRDVTPVQINITDSINEQRIVHLLKLWTVHEIRYRICPYYFFPLRFIENDEGGNLPKVPFLA